MAVASLSGPRCAWQVPDAIVVVYGRVDCGAEDVEPAGFSGAGSASHIGPITDAAYFASERATTLPYATAEPVTTIGANP